MSNIHFRPIELVTDVVAVIGTTSFAWGTPNEATLLLHLQIGFMTASICWILLQMTFKIISWKKGKDG